MKLKKPKKKTPKKLKAELWELCKKITRIKYLKKDGSWDCFTCGKMIDEPAKAHTAHFIPSGSCGAYLRYDLRNLRIGCYHCNINLGGNGATYYVKMVDENGQDYVNRIFQDKNQIVKADEYFYQSKIDEYTELYTVLCGSKK